MGCSQSGLPSGRPFFKRSVNPRVFHVLNVDENGNCGKIEVTDTDLILHRRGKNSICWPLRGLRRYGFDSELFSFECGRRCPTGPGIYAFQCSRAEQLFNLIQELANRQATGPSAANGQLLTQNLPQNLRSGSVNVDGNGDHITLPSPTHLLHHIPEPGPRSRRPSSQISSLSPHLYSNEIRDYINSPFYVNTSTLPQMSASPLPTSQSSTGNGATDVNTNYAKLDDLVRYYVNIKTPTCAPPPLPGSHPTVPIKLANGGPKPKLPHKALPVSANYSNVANGGAQPGDGATAVPLPPTANQSSCSSPPSPTALVIEDATPDLETPQPQPPAVTPSLSPSGEEPLNYHRVNYIMLDLDTTADTNLGTGTGTGAGVHFVTTAPATPVSKSPKGGENTWNTTPPDTPTSLTSMTSGANCCSSLVPQQYATIDFDKTLALNNSAADHRNQRKPV